MSLAHAGSLGARQGTGGVPIGVQIAVTPGAKVTSTMRSDDKLARLEALSPPDGINHARTKGCHKAARELTGSLGVARVRVNTAAFRLPPEPRVPGTIDAAFPPPECKRPSSLL